MSAFIVERGHVNGMLKGGFSVAAKHNDKIRWRYNREWRELTHSNASEIGQLLMDECIKSVSARYPDDKVTELPGRIDAEYLLPFEFYPLGRIPQPLELISITKCYMYQSCEHDEWENSEARVFCKALIEQAISTLPGYDDAPWEWHEDIPTNKPIRIV